MDCRTTESRMPGGSAIRVLAPLAVLLACPLALAQNFYQVSNPRTYRISPAVTPSLPPGLVPQMLAHRSVAANGVASLIVSWHTAEDEPSQALEVTVDLATTPPPESENDAALIAQIPAFEVATALDCQSDQRAVVIARTVGTQQGLIGAGALTLNQQGNIINMELATRISPPLVSGGLGNNIGPQGIGFGGVRNIAGGTYDTILVMFADDPAGLWAMDAVTGVWLDAQTGNFGGANVITPIVPWSGNTGAVNLDPGRHQLRGVVSVGDTAFMLTARLRDPNDANSIEYYLVQVNLLVQQVLAVVNLADLFDSRITSPSAALGGDLDVITNADGTLRILLSTPGSTKYIGELDGRLVPNGSPPIADGSTPTPPANAVIWVCPGFGIALPITALAAGLGLSGAMRARRGRLRGATHGEAKARP